MDDRIVGGIAVAGGVALGVAVTTVVVRQRRKYLQQFGPGEEQRALEDGIQPDYVSEEEPEREVAGEEPASGPLKIDDIHRTAVVPAGTPVLDAQGKATVSALPTTVTKPQKVASDGTDRDFVLGRKATDKQGEPRVFQVDTRILVEGITSIVEEDKTLAQFVEVARRDPATGRLEDLKDGETPMRGYVMLGKGDLEFDIGLIDRIASAVSREGAASGLSDPDERREAIWAAGSLLARPGRFGFDRVKQGLVGPDQIDPRVVGPDPAIPDAEQDASSCSEIFQSLTRDAQRRIWRETTGAELTDGEIAQFGVWLRGKILQGFTDPTAARMNGASFCAAVRSAAVMGEVAVPVDLVATDRTGEQQQAAEDAVARMLEVVIDPRAMACAHAFSSLPIDKQKTIWKKFFDSDLSIGDVQGVVDMLPSAMTRWLSDPTTGGEELCAVIHKAAQPGGAETETPHEVATSENRGPGIKPSPNVLDPIIPSDKTTGASGLTAYAAQQLVQPVPDPVTPSCGSGVCMRPHSNASPEPSGSTLFKVEAAADPELVDPTQKNYTTVCDGSCGGSCGGGCVKQPKAKHRGSSCGCRGRGCPKCGRRSPTSNTSLIAPFGTVGFRQTDPSLLQSPIGDGFDEDK